MKNSRQYQAQKIGFLAGSGAQQPGMPPTIQAPRPFGGPFSGGGLFPGGNPMMPPSTPPVSPFNMGAPGGGGLGGMLQGLLGGGGSLNLPVILSNTQKVIGAINQAGEVFKNIGPMLQLLQGLNSSDLLADDESSDIEKSQPKRKKAKKKRKRKSKKKRTRRATNKAQ